MIFDHTKHGGVTVCRLYLCVHSLSWVQEDQIFSLLLPSFIFSFSGCLSFLPLDSLSPLENRQAGEPALENGFIPYLGCALQFGANPLYFLRSRQNKYGHIFTCKIAGQFIHFLCDPFSYHSVIRQGRHLDWRKFHFATSVKVNYRLLILGCYISFEPTSRF